MKREAWTFTHARGIYYEKRTQCTELRVDTHSQSLSSSEYSGQKDEKKKGRGKKAGKQRGTITVHVYPRTTEHAMDSFVSGRPPPSWKAT